jgi:hypothetical protein
MNTVQRYGIEKFREILSEVYYFLVEEGELKMVITIGLEPTTTTMSR